MSDSRINALRDDLLNAQAQLISDKSFALAIVVTGMPTAGRSEVVNAFLEWLDAKHIKVHALNDLRKGAESIPPMKRYWATVPAKGKIAIYFSGWYEDYVVPCLQLPKDAGKREAARALERAQQFETMLHHDGVRIVKLDLRVERKTQKERIQALLADKSTRWRVTREDLWLAQHHKQLRKAMDRAIEATDTPIAKWHVIDGADPQRRLIEAGRIVLKELQKGLQPPRELKPQPWPATHESADESHFAFAEQPLDNESYKRSLADLQRRLALLTRKKAFTKHSVVLAFEGMDAAGKGGAIRRMTAALDARQYTVIPVSAPTPEELARPYLWRFWRNLPERGEFAIFDRSWYGRVLVERVRDLTPDPDWQRAYEEINAFELQLAEANMIVHKFWLSVSKEEQFKRLKDREREPLKRFKLDKEDWANRRYFGAYQVAAAEMIERTSTPHAPWTVVEADNKKFARVKVLETVCAALEAQLKK